MTLEDRCLEVAREILHHNRYDYELSLRNSLREDPHDLRDLCTELEDLDEMESLP